MTINDRIQVAQDSELLPNSTLSLEEARRLLGTRHLMKEQLTKGEREILYAAESLLRYVGRLREECYFAAAMLGVDPANMQQRAGRSKAP